MKGRIMFYHNMLFAPHKKKEVKDRKHAFLLFVPNLPQDWIPVPSEKKKN